MDQQLQRFQFVLQSFIHAMQSDILNKMKAQITGPQMFMLHFIIKHGPCKLTKIAEKMEVKPSAVTVMIDRLEKSGYVNRVQDKADRRAILVEGTAQGKKVLEQATRERNEILEHYLSRLEAKEARLLIELLEKMVKMDPPNPS